MGKVKKKKFNDYNGNGGDTDEPSTPMSYVQKSESLFSSLFSKIDFTSALEKAKREGKHLLLFIQEDCDDHNKIRKEIESRKILEGLPLKVVCVMVINHKTYFGDYQLAVLENSLPMIYVLDPEREDGSNIVSTYMQFRIDPLVSDLVEMYGLENVDSGMEKMELEDEEAEEIEPEGVAGGREEVHERLKIQMRELRKLKKKKEKKMKFKKEQKRRKEGQKFQELRETVEERQRKHEEEVRKAELKAKRKYEKELLRKVRLEKKRRKKEREKQSKKKIKKTKKVVIVDTLDDPDTALQESEDSLPSPMTPLSPTDADSCVLKLKLPDGSMFNITELEPDSKVVDLRKCVSRELESVKFRLVVPYPMRKILDFEKDAQTTMRELGLCPSGIIYVETERGRVAQASGGFFNFFLMLWGFVWTFITSSLQMVKMLVMSLFGRCLQRGNQVEEEAEEVSESPPDDGRFDRYNGNSTVFTYDGDKK